MPHVGMPAKSVDRGGHGKWVVDTDQGRDHEQVRQGVCEGVEEGQEAGILRRGLALAAWSRDNALSAAGGPHSAAMDKPTHS